MLQRKILINIIFGIISRQNNWIIASLSGIYLIFLRIKIFVMKKHNATKTVLLIFLFLSTVSAANAASFVIVVYVLPCLEISKINYRFA